ncbi:MAG: hypothetical protein MUC89_07960 [Acetobacteraceae bacterium]|nr:hypothetical protein [Acetobacteraceae bacterium]
MRLAAPLLCLLAAAACAPLQEHRSPAEAACAAEAERIVLDRNRARSVRLDAPGTGAQTIMEETNVSASFARESEFAERRRLTRECLERLGARPPQGQTPQGQTPQGQTPQGQSGAPPSGRATQPAAPAPAAPASAVPASSPPPQGGIQRGTALPPPSPAQPPVRGW